MPRRDPRAGFSLIEVLAALAITGALVTVALPFAARLATRWWVGERTVEVADAWMQAIARLDDDLSQAVPIVLHRNGQTVTAFSAGPDFVEFVRPALGAASAIALDTVRFELQPHSGGSALVRRSRRFSPESFFDGGTSTATPTILLEGSLRLSFTIVGPDERPRAAWMGQPEMPVAIELAARPIDAGTAPPSPILIPIVAKRLPAVGPTR